jgi:hypothetical protein
METMPAQRFAFTEILCPETGQPITVAKNVESDPVGQLQLTPHQRAAADAYQADHEALSGSLRAPGDGLSWKGHKPHADKLRQPRQRLARAQAILGPRRTRLLDDVLIGLEKPTDVLALQRVLDEIAPVYGLSTRPRSRTSNLWRNS